MPPQLWAILRQPIALFSSLAATLALPPRALPALCSALNLPTGPTTYVASATGAGTPGNVVVIDAAFNTLACTIPVRKAPLNLALIPTSNQLFVDTDGAASVTVLN